MNPNTPLSKRLRNLVIGAAAAGALAAGVAAPPASALPAPAVGTAQVASSAAPQLGSYRTIVAMPSAKTSSQRRLTAKTKRVLRAVRSKFPQVRSIGGYRPTSSGEHGKGRALDVMLPKWKSAKGKKLGKKISSWARSNAGRLKIWYVIYNQRIWNVQRKNDGWRKMRNGGSATANHKNHVHISVKR